MAAGAAGAAVVIGAKSSGGTSRRQADIVGRPESVSGTLVLRADQAGRAFSVRVAIGLGVHTRALCVTERRRTWSPALAVQRGIRSVAPEVGPGRWFRVDRLPQNIVANGSVERSIVG